MITNHCYSQCRYVQQVFIMRSAVFLLYCRQEELVSLISGARAWGGATSGPPPQQTDFKLHTPAVYPLELPGPLFIVQYSVRRSVVYAVQYSAQFSVQYSMAEWGVQVFSGL